MKSGVIRKKSVNMNEVWCNSKKKGVNMNGNREYSKRWGICKSVAARSLKRAVVLGLCTALYAQGSPRFANVFGDHQVLQRDMPVPVWGTAAPGEAVTVTFAGQAKTATADRDGRWRVTLDPMPANAEPRELIVQAPHASRLTLHDVLVGDVWLCAGAAGQFDRGTAWLYKNAAKEVENASVPQVRLLRPDIYTSVLPVEEINAARWTAVAPEVIGMFPISWYFGRELNAAAGVPIGLIQVHRNSESTADWLAWKVDPKDGRQAQALEAMKAHLPENVAVAQRWLDAFRTWKPGEPLELVLPAVYLPFDFYGGYHPDFQGPYPFFNTRSKAYNFLIAPFSGMAVRGVVFLNEFGRRFMVSGQELVQIINSWREVWGRPELPFLMVPPIAQSELSGKADKALETVGVLPGVKVMGRENAEPGSTNVVFWQRVAAVAKETPIGALGTPSRNLPPPCALAVAPASSRFEVAAIFGDNMVLQAGKPVPVWGWGTPGAEVSVSFAGQTLKTAVNKEGEWRVVLKSLIAGTSPGVMTITSQEGTQRESRSLTNALVGEVWLNSGQSNAGFALRATTGFAEEQPRANWPQIRYFMSWKTSSVLPLRRPHGQWVVVTPETAGAMPGQGYYFARLIHRELKMPVGIIEASLGGSTIFAWTSDRALAASPRLEKLCADRVRMRDKTIAELPACRDALERWIEGVSRNGQLERPMPYYPVNMGAIHYILKPMDDRGSELYNVMIYPLIGFALRGTLWNQGEADTGAGLRADVYDELMVTMVADWRQSWADPFPIYFVQMPAIKGRNGMTQIWEKQTLAMRRIPDSGMIVCNDIVDGDIHPRNKKDVGERLARLALARTYNVKGIIDSSPFMKSVAREGRQVVVTFTPVGEGLRTRDGKASDSWEVAGRDGKFVPARAEIAGDRVVVSAESIAQPTAVRLGWSSDSNCNLVNSAGLPAMPFTATIKE